LAPFDPQQGRRVYEHIPIAEAIAVTSLALRPLLRCMDGVTRMDVFK
jgi:predicted membrane-bound dolichyl-phosphate-mannose-protein mannosyltransferase